MSEPNVRWDFARERLHLDVVFAAVIVEDQIATKLARRAALVPCVFDVLIGNAETVDQMTPQHRKAKLLDLFRATHSPKTSRMPFSICFNFVVGTAATRSVRIDLSNVANCETFTTESFGNPESRERNSTLPGAACRRRLEVKTAAITVAMRLRLKSSCWMIRTGRR